MQSLAIQKRGRRIGTALSLALAVVAAVVPPSVARADVVSDVQADLAAAGITSATVAIETPAGTSTILDETTEAQLTFSQLKPYLSPNPAAPLPILDVTLNVGQGAPLSGILTTPGLGRKYTTLPATLVPDRMAVIEAAKHLIASGQPLSGVEISFNTSEDVPPVLIGLPDTSDFPPKQSFANLMPVDSLKQRIQLQLPAWAAEAKIDVTTDHAGERIVAASLALPARVLAVNNVADLSAALGEAQLSMVSDGANIGRTIVKVTDTLTGDPLYVSADDRYWTYRSAWYSPLIAGFAGDGLFHDSLGPTRGAPPTSLQPLPPKTPALPGGT